MPDVKAHSDFLAIFKGPISNGMRRGKEKGRGGDGSDGKGKREREKRVEEGREGWKGLFSRILLFEPWKLCQIFGVSRNTAPAVSSTPALNISHFTHFVWTTVESARPDAAFGCHGAVA